MSAEEPSRSISLQSSVLSPWVSPLGSEGNFGGPLRRRLAAVSTALCALQPTYSLRHSPIKQRVLTLQRELASHAHHRGTEGHRGSRTLFPSRCALCLYGNGNPRWNTK